MNTTVDPTELPAGYQGYRHHWSEGVRVSSDVIMPDVVYNWSAGEDIFRTHARNHLGPFPDIPVPPLDVLSQGLDGTRHAGPGPEKDILHITGDHLLRVHHAWVRGAVEDVKYARKSMIDQGLPSDYVQTVTGGASAVEPRSGKVPYAAYAIQHARNEFLQGIIHYTGNRRLSQSELDGYHQETAHLLAAERGKLDAYIDAVRTDFARETPVEDISEDISSAAPEASPAQAELVTAAARQAMEDVLRSGLTAVHAAWGEQIASNETRIDALNARNHPGGRGGGRG